MTLLAGSTPSASTILDMTVSLACDNMVLSRSHESISTRGRWIYYNVPSNSSLPCDVAIFAPLKAVYRDEVERLERGDVNTIGKERFT
ncbi:hypothetical protein GGP41_007089 [Bipolaris sorokiniana]|uniref:Uncharacterized protein n=1 Tax=Cochliobolus sativus TaxID=45130 RepID=A0A8H5ZSD3_COCSA|nr:hypothetical protein GGP41_007089 [Bipolaris sorokiniana]